MGTFQILYCLLFSYYFLSHFGFLLKFVFYRNSICYCICFDDATFFDRFSVFYHYFYILLWFYVIYICLFHLWNFILLYFYCYILICIFCLPLCCSAAAPLKIWFMLSLCLINKLLLSWMVKFFQSRKIINLWCMHKKNNLY